MEKMTKLREIRLQRNLKLIEVASRAKMQIARLSIIEQGYFPPTEKELTKISQVLGCDISDLIDEPEAIQANEK